MVEQGGSSFLTHALTDLAVLLERRLCSPNGADLDEVAVVVAMAGPVAAQNHDQPVMVPAGAETVHLAG
jgi:hypothetical protein